MSGGGSFVSASDGGAAAREMWIGVNDDGATFLHRAEPEWWEGEWATIGGAAAFVADLGAVLPVSIPPGHKAKLVLDEASVTKGGA